MRDVQSYKSEEYLILSGNAAEHLFPTVDKSQLHRQSHNQEENIDAIGLRRKNTNSTRAGTHFASLKDSSPLYHAVPRVTVANPINPAQP